jgi:hypothetical protein
MARPIAETPVLTGENARRFEARMQNIKPISEERRQRMERNWEIFKKNAQFPI